MIANKVKIGLETEAIKIDPVFKDVDYKIISWDIAISKYLAKAKWSQLENAESYGLFTVGHDGRAFFAPRKAGSFKVNCEVYFREENSVWNSIDQELTITVIKDNDDCTCEIKISAKDL